MLVISNFSFAHNFFSTILEDKGLWKTRGWGLGRGREMLVISNFSFAHNFFLPFWKKKAFGKHGGGDWGEEEKCW